MGDKLKNYFEDFLKKDPIFSNKKVLQTNYDPDKMSYRDEQLEAVASILAPALRMEKPSNIFLYGKPGTGKTLLTKHVTKQISDLASKNDLPLNIVYINCKMKRVADTEYRLMVQLASEFGKKIPATGLPTDEVYKIFIKAIDDEKKLIVLILDEVDQLVKKAGDEILYNLTRLNSELKNVELSFIGISNDLLFLDNIDPRVKSSLSEEEFVFPPYNAIQIRGILKERSEGGFRSDVVAAGVIEKCAAYAAREHGDARRALDLLRVAGELAERKNKQEVTIEDIDEAEEKIEKDKIMDIVSTQPKQHQLTLLSIFSISDIAKDHIFTGDVYEVYQDFCNKIKVKPLTQRRVSDIIAELDMLGIINVKVISKGRYGRTREIRLAIPSSSVLKIKSILKEGLNL